MDDRAFTRCRYPSMSRQIKLGNALGLEPNQIKLWFQNQRKFQSDSADNDALEASNKRLRHENSVMREIIKTSNCPSCADLSLTCGKDCCNVSLLQEYSQLKDECTRASDQLIIYCAKEFTESLLDLTAGSAPQHRALNPLLHPNPVTKSTISYPDSPFGLRDPEVENFLLNQIAESTTDELVKLMDDKYWVKSETEGQQILHLENYQCAFPRSNFSRPNEKRKESSKACGLMRLAGKELVDILLDTRRGNYFISSISEPLAMRVLASGDSISRSGALHLVYEQMQAISPFIQSREFHILRHCRKIDIGKWVIADISFKYGRNGPHVCPALHLRHPSGCLIRDLSNGYSEVTWVEHVIVDAKEEAPQLYKDVVQSGLAFGAVRWLCTLHRMIERQKFLGGPCSKHEFNSESEASWKLPTLSRADIIVCCQRMLTSFCYHLDTFGKLDISQHTVVDKEGVRIVVKKNVAPGEPAGFVFSAATSVWLPVPPINVFNFLSAANKRSKWDSLCCEEPAHIAARILTGSYQENDITIIAHQPNLSNLILQENSIDSLGARIVFVPCYQGSEKAAYVGSSGFKWLSSGFAISTDGRSNPSRPSSSTSVAESGGCILAPVFNFSHVGPDSPCVDPVFSILTSTMEKIKLEFCKEPPAFRSLA